MPANAVDNLSTYADVNDSLWAFALQVAMLVLETRGGLNPSLRDSVPRCEICYILLISMALETIDVPNRHELTGILRGIHCQCLLECSSI